MRFKTKWDLLEHLGKDRKYVRYVDKLMMKDIVVMIDWEYDYDDPYEEEIQWYKDRIHELEHTIKDKDKELKEKDELILWQNSYIKELEEKENWNDERELLNKVYRYLTRVLHINVEYDAFIEWIENN